jgi:hypothetical protein
VLDEVLEQTEDLRLHGDEVHAAGQFEAIRVERVSTEAVDHSAATPAKR